MRKGIARGLCATLATAALLTPPAASAQPLGGLSNRVNPESRGDVRNRSDVRGRADSRDRHDFRSRNYFRSRNDSWSRGGHRSRDRFRSSFGIWIGPGWDSWWWPFYYPGPSYYPYPYPYPYPDPDPYPDRYAAPPPVAPPPVYDQRVREPQREESSPQEPPASDRENPVPEEYRWYYCQDPPGYYPYVRDCPGGWTQVAPGPAPER